MTSLLNPVTGVPVIPDLAKAMALPNAMEMLPTLAHPLANKVGWFNLNNISCGLLGMPLGFAGDLHRQPVHQGTVEGDAGLRRRDPQAARQDGTGRKDLIAARRFIGSGALPGPAFFRDRCAAYAKSVAPRMTRLEPANSERIRSVLTYWYFHLPNFVLAALMYTLFGRISWAWSSTTTSKNYIWRFFCRIDRSGHQRSRARHTQGRGAGHYLVFALVWLFWLRIAFFALFAVLDLLPKF